MCIGHALVRLETKLNISSAIIVIRVPARGFGLAYTALEVHSVRLWIFCFLDDGHGEDEWALSLRR
jgi:hypothetical protein